MKQIYHKKNELLEVEFYKDEECTETFDFMDEEDLYIELKDGDISPLVKLNPILAHRYRKFGFTTTIYTPYIADATPNIRDYLSGQGTMIYTINDITPNLSKYIPRDNAVLFLRREDKKLYVQSFINHNSLSEDVETYKIALQIHNIDALKAVTIFLPQGTKSELQKANEVAKELKEKYGVEEVNLFVLHCFIENLQNYTGEICAIKFKNDIRFAKFDFTDIDIAMARIEDNLDKHLYTYNVTKAEGVVSRFKEFAEDSLESDEKLEDLRMQYGEDFTIIPKHIKTKALDDIKKSLQAYKTDLQTHSSFQMKYLAYKCYFSEDLYFHKEGFFNKIITTNSTGILEPQDTKRLQVIDCKEIFEENN